MEHTSTWLKWYSTTASELWIQPQSTKSFYKGSGCYISQAGGVKQALGENHLWNVLLVRLAILAASTLPLKSPDSFNPAT